MLPQLAREHGERRQLIPGGVQMLGRGRQLVGQRIDNLAELLTHRLGVGLVPAGRLYLICDNYGPHRKAEVRTWCADHDVELVFTPTDASWLNWIECEFTALRYFALDGSDYPSHAAQETAIARYIRWANKHTAPKQYFAVNSKIRRPDYLPNVA